MFLRSRGVGAVFEELIALFRPSVVHVREERERLELMREEEGDASRRLGDDAHGVRVSVPAGWEAPRGPRRREDAYDSRGIQA